MWKVLPKFGLLKAIFYLFSIVLIAVVTLSFQKTNGLVGASFADTIKDASKLVAPVVLFYLVIIYLIGRWCWRIFWIIPGVKQVLNKGLCPDLNGKWIGETTSTYTDSNGDRKITPVEMHISADLFGFSIKLISEDRYQSSDAVLSGIHKDQRTNSFFISYIFESTVDLPQEGDVAFFDGAGKLKVYFEEKDILLKGVYWTNRGWEKGETTAGNITLRKVA